jgi:hypothetical protein
VIPPQQSHHETPLEQAEIQAPQSGRAIHQPDQALPSCGHTLRKNRQELSVVCSPRVGARIARRNCQHDLVSISGD